MFKIGDRAVILFSPGGRCTGQITTIMSDLRRAIDNTQSGLIRAGDLVYEVDIQSPVPGKYCVARPEWLGPIDDGNEVVSWSHCVWQPRELEMNR